jgi:tetratricopeptide (TPR) repeat protein
LGSAGFLALVLLAAYWPALHGGRLWDDDAHLTTGALQSLAGLGQIWFRLGATQQYYPVLHSAFWIEHRLWGDAVFGYHLLNVALHGCAAWLLVRVLRQLAFPAAGLAGLAFAVHPVAVESVAWISEQKNTLSAVFYLGAAWGYLHWEAGRHAPRGGDSGGTGYAVQDEAGRRTELRRPAYYWAASGLFVLALLTKSVTATLPAALLVARWWQAGRLLRRDVAPLLPWFAVAAISGAFTAWVERTYIGASGADFNLSGAQRLALAGRAIVFYAAKVVWPRHLMFIYPRWTIDARSPAAWFGLGAVTIVLLALAVVARRRRGPLAAALFFGATLFPALGFVNVYPFVFSFVADHFQYLASIGVLAPLSWALGTLASCPRWSATTGRASPSSDLNVVRASAPGGRALPQPPRTLQWTILLLWPAVLGVMTFRQAGLYRDADTLNRGTLAANPDAWLAHYNLAVSLGQQPNGQAEAIAHYRETVRLKPDHWAAHCNLATALVQAGQPAAAIAEYQTALVLNPNFAEAHNDLAVILGREPGGRDEAIRHLRAAVRLRPDYDGAHSNLGVQFMRSPATRPEAAQEFQAAVRLAPDNPEYHYNLADAWSDDPAHREAAVAEYRTALRLRPDYLAAHANLAALLVHLPGRAQEAIAEYQAALRLAPANAPLHFQLAIALIVARRPRAAAAAELETALRLQPDLKPARLLLDKLR